ncbi:Aspartate racemase [Handroanthus impetiginosus]|uniref:Aspartate racemase n=1 Tax=Handroanthus impetiginosus TaxID=429701 RepID=A0A2G9H0R0_9LAMI|nr:Aspartate racemase [Handroanthus impetiginosus]
MSLSFQSLNYPSNISYCISKHTSHSQGKRNPSLLKLPSSIIPQAAESPLINKPSSDRTFSSFQLIGQEANGIGIIGGVSAYSSLNFANKLVKFKLEKEESSPPFVLCSDPALSKELLSLERGSFPFLSAKTQSLQSDYTLIVENLREKRVFLEKFGVCCIVMPCDISHSWYDEIKDGCSVPCLHVGECVAKELKEAKLRPLEAGSPLRIGVLATNETSVARFYREKLENEGFEVILPDKATVEHTVIPLVEALNRKDLEGAQNLFRIALQVLLVRAMNRIILASDELRQLLPPDDPLWRKCIDPMDALARSSLKYAQPQGRCK